MSTMIVKPAKGLRVPNPATGQPLPEEGAEVPRDQYWTRRILDLEVIEVNQVTRKSSRRSDSS